MLVLHFQNLEFVLGLEKGSTHSIPSATWNLRKVKVQVSAWERTMKNLTATLCECLSHLLMRSVCGLSVVLQTTTTCCHRCSAGSFAKSGRERNDALFSLGAYVKASLLLAVSKDNGEVDCSRNTWGVCLTFTQGSPGRIEKGSQSHPFNTPYLCYYHWSCSAVHVLILVCQGSIMEPTAVGRVGHVSFHRMASTGKCPKVEPF